MGFYSIISNANVTYCLRTVSQHIWRILHTLHIQYNIQLAKGFYMKFSDVPIKMPTDLLTSYRIWAFVHDSSRGILLERCTPFVLNKMYFLYSAPLYSPPFCSVFRKLQDLRYQDILSITRTSGIVGKDRNSTTGMSYP